MKITPLALDGLLLIEPTRHEDARGWFSESFRQDRLDAAVGAPVRFVQDNRSLSRAINTVRGLHYQAPPRAQAKLVSCEAGAVLDVAVDARAGSPTYGRSLAVELSAENGRQLFIPEGFLHGFRTLTPQAQLFYKVTDYFDAALDGAVLWDSAGVDWGMGETPILSDKDRDAPPFTDWVSPFA